MAKRGLGSVGRRQATALPVLVVCAISASGVAWALPQDGNVVAGGATISQPAPNRMEVRQSTNRAVIDWRGFSIGQGEQVTFQQPSSASVALNRVTGPDASRIDGRLSANGQVFLVNPNGVMVGPTGLVDVSGLVATTANISNSDFMAGQYKFDKPGRADAKVVNEGQISVAEGGIAALVAPSVRNAGVIEARLGKVALAAGNKFTLDLNGDRLVNIAISDAQAARLENSGQILADGGTVTLSAAAARDAVSEVVNTGVVRARSVAEKNGVIVLDAGAGAASIAGTLDASGANAGETGGTVTVSADAIALSDTARIDVSGAAGGGTALVGGGVQGKDPALRNARTVDMAAGARIDASATRRGKGGTVVLWSEERTRFMGGIAARGGAEGGDGGFVETSSKINLQAYGSVDAAAPLGEAGQWLLDPRNVTITTATAGGSFGGGNPNTFTPTADNATVDVATINTALNAGTSITITTGADGTQNGDITVASTINKSTGNTNATLTLSAAGNIAINAGAGITRTGTGTGRLDVALNAGASSGNVAINAPVTLTTNNGSLTTTGGGTFQNGGTGAIALGTGALSITAGAVSFGANATVGSAAVTATTGNITVASTINRNAGNANTTANLTAAGNIAINSGGITRSTGGTGRLDVVLNAGAASGTVTVNAPITLTTNNGTLTTTGGGAFQNASAIGLGTGSASITAGSIALGANLTGGTTTLTANSGAVTQSAGAITATTLTVNATDSSTLNQAGNNAATLVASITGTSKNLTYRDTNALALGTTSVTGNLTINTSGAITDTGVITVDGTSSFNAGAGVITLDSATNQFGGAVSLSNTGNNDVVLTNAKATGTNLGTFSLGRNLTVNSTGAITQSGVLTVTGTSSFNAGANAITFDLSNQLAGAVSFFTTGDNNATVTNGRATVLGSSTVGGNLSITASTGGFTQSSGAVSAAGTTTLSSTNGDIALSGGTLSAGTTLTLAANANGTKVTQTGGSLQAGSLSVTAKDDSTLTQSGNDVGTLTVNLTTAGKSLTYVDANDIALSGTTTVGGNLSVTSLAGNVTQSSGTVSLTGTASTLTLTSNTGNVTQSGGSMSLTGGSSTINLSAAQGAVTQSGGNVVANALSVTAQNTSSLTPATNTNNVATVSASITGAGADFSYTDNSGGVAIGAITAAGGDVAVTANAGNITVTGPIATSGGDVTATATAGAITATGTVSAGAGTVKLTAGGGAVTQGAGSITGAALAVSATANSSLTQAGNDVGIIASSITTANKTFAYTDTNAVTIGSAGGLTGVSSTGAATIVGTAVGLGQASVPGGLTVTANGGNITQSTGTVNAGAGAVTLTANGGGAVTQTGGDADRR
jgi:filamentous hemagglutinin family protein